MSEMMVQCRLLKENRTQVAWIPLVENLKIGSIVEIKSEDSDDKHGWKNFRNVVKTTKRSRAGKIAGL